jgi:hypothetical protein
MSMMISWAISGATCLLLVLFGLHNRRIGYRKPRMQSWMEEVSGDALAREPFPEVMLPMDNATTEQLIRLYSALQPKHASSDVRAARESLAAVHARH